MSDIGAQMDQIKARQEDLAAEFERLSADLYAQMHEIKRISDESVKAFDHHVSLLKRAKRIEEQLRAL